MYELGHGIEAAGQLQRERERRAETMGKASREKGEVVVSVSESRKGVSWVFLLGFYLSELCV